ncbi:hypothetical protein MTO96_006549 [Rhipicephalus appendiculatus]
MAYYSAHEKRKATEGALVPVKKPRHDIVSASDHNKRLQLADINRTSSLEAPIMLLTGHLGQIFFWNTLGECENFGVLSGHTGAVLDMHFSTDGSLLFTASTDKTLGVWDTHHGGAHSSSAVAVTTAHSSCGTHGSAHRLTVSRRATRSQQCPSMTRQSRSSPGGIDNQIKVWDMRKNAVLYRMMGHLDTITGLSLSPDGSYILSNSMDNTLRIWDVRPFAPQERCVKILQGHMHNFEKNLLRCAWSPDGSKVTAGSADRYVHIWDTTSRRLIYKLPGHNGSVNDIQFHPKEPIVLSVASDKQVYLGEIDK